MPEFLVLAFVWAQQFAEILSGIHEKREIELENIQEAKERFLVQFGKQAHKIISETKRETKSDLS